MNRWTFVSWLFLLLLNLAFNCTALVAQRPETVVLNLDRESVQIAEPFVVELVGTTQVGEQLHFPQVSEKLGVFDVIDQVDRFDLPVVGDPQKRTWLRRMTLETLDTGHLEIPGFELTLVGANSSRRRLSIPPRKIHVLSVLEGEADTSRFSDIRDVVDLEEPKVISYGWVGWLAGGAIGLTGLAGLLMLITRRKNWITPSTWALQRLSDQSEGSAYEIEWTLRVFLEKEFGFPATSFTVEQITAELKQQSVSENVCQRLSEIFVLAERSKFAGLELGPDQRSAMIENAVDLVGELDSLEQEAP